MARTSLFILVSLMVVLGKAVASTPDQCAADSLAVKLVCNVGWIDGCRNIKVSQTSYCRSINSPPSSKSLFMQKAGVLALGAAVMPNAEFASKQFQRMSIRHSHRLPRQPARWRR